MDPADQPSCSYAVAPTFNINRCFNDNLQNNDGNDSDASDTTIPEDLTDLKNYGTVGRLSGGRRRSAYQDVTTARLRQSMMTSKSRKHCEYVVASEQTLVYAICLALGKILAFNPDKGKESRNYWRRIRRNCQKSPSAELEKLATRLRSEAGLPPANVFVGLNALDRIQRIPMLRGVVIRVFQEGTKQQVWPPSDSTLHFAYSDHVIDLCLYHHGGNIFFAVIWGLVTFLSARGYCESCKEVQFGQKRHICPFRCSYCGIVALTSTTKTTSLLCDCDKVKGEERTCPDCLRKFFSTFCFRQHLHRQGRGQWSIPRCYAQRLCSGCGHYFSLKRREDGSFVNSHNCSGERTFGCAYCKKQIQLGVPHEACYLPVLKPHKIEKSKKIVFLDLETRICSSTNVHKANLLTTVVSCSRCWRKDMYAPCAKCGIARVCVWSGEKCVYDFVESFFCMENANATIVSHFGSRFDFHFLLSALIEQCKMPETTFSRGNRLLYVKFKCGIKLICWANYIPTSLENLCKSFEVPVAKSFFCYDMNEEYVTDAYCHLRPKWEFPVSGRNSNDFDLYHVEHYDKVFCVFEEMSIYCQRDSYALSYAAMRFREELINLLAVDLFAETGTFTISGLALRVFQIRFLQEDTLAIYRGEALMDRNSRFSMAFLTAYSRYFGVHVQHAGNDHEYVVRCSNNRQYKVDGAEFEEDTGTPSRLIDIHGCFFHSCPMCTKHLAPVRPLTLLGGKTPLQVRERDFFRANNIAKTVHPLLYDVYWEHECRNVLSSNRVMKQFFTEALSEKPLSIYDANFGGRIDTFQIGTYDNMNVTKPNADFLDFCSLYPAMCLTKPMAQGPGKVVSEGGISGDLNEWVLTHFGIVKAWVHYPRANIFVPPLPFRAKLPGGDEKIFYSTCAACCIEQNVNVCTHTFQEQIFRGTWTTVELCAAIKYTGLKIVRIVSAHVYESRVWSRDAGVESGLISAFMLAFYKLKCQASDLPPDKSAAEYSAEIAERFGIYIAPRSFAPNPVKRSVAKLMINSLIGKFAQKKSGSQTEFFKDHGSLLKVLENPNLNVHWLQHFGSADATKLGLESSVMVQHSISQDSTLAHVGPNNAFSVPIITTMVTGYARVELYEAMIRIPEECLLYTDTDSIMALDGSNLQSLCGHHLGQLTPVLKDQYKLEHVCIVGPKQYAYTAKNSTTGESYKTVRLRGFATAAETDQQGQNNRKPTVSYDNMCDAVRSLLEQTELKKLGLNELNFLLSKDFTISIDGRKKYYKPVSNKRFFVPPGVGGATAIRTFPYGYNRI